MTRGKAWDSETRERAVELLKMGQSYAAIARELAIPEPTVRGWCDDWFVSEEAQALIRSNKVPTVLLAQKVEQACIVHSAKLVAHPDLSPQDASLIGRFANTVRVRNERELARVATQRGNSGLSPRIVEIPVAHDPGKTLPQLPLSYVERIANGEPCHEVVEAWQAEQRRAGQERIAEAEIPKADIAEANAAGVDDGCAH